MLTLPTPGLSVALAAAAFPALALALPDAGYPAAALTLLLVLLLWRRGDWPAPDARRELVWLLLACLAMVLAVAASILANQVSWKGMQYPARFLFLPLLAWPLARLPFAARPFWYGCAAGGMAAGGLALAQYAGGMLRPAGYLNPIMFGNFALCLAAFCLVALLAIRPGRAGRLLLAGGLLGGLLTNLLAESRGGWLALLLAAGLLPLLAARQVPVRRRRRLAAGVAVAAALLAATTWQLGKHERLLDMVRNTAAYLEQDVGARTSEADRLEMWKNALAIWRQSPWLGVGPGTLHEAYAARIRAGRMDSRAADYRHAHNQYLDALATGGVVGLAGLLAVLCVPLAVFLRRLRTADGPDGRAYALAGVVLGLLYLGFNLTQAMFAHNLGIVFYLFMLAVCWRGALAGGATPSARPVPGDT